MSTLVEGSSPRYLSTGHILFARDDSLWAVAFDADRLEVTGSPTPVLEKVQTDLFGFPWFSVARNGSLAFAPGVSRKRMPVWVDRERRATPLAEDQRDFRYPRLSPDGKRVVLNVMSGERVALFLNPIAVDEHESRPDEVGRPASRQRI